MNNIKTIKPFSVVSAPYTDLKGSIKTFDNGVAQRGLFLVLRIDDCDNILAVKITSQYNKFINDFCYIMRQSSHQFLRADSYVQLDKWHTLDASECIVLGQTSPTLRMALLRKFEAITYEVSNCLKDNISMVNISKPYVSPNSRRSGGSYYGFPKNKRY